MITHFLPGDRVRSLDGVGFRYGTVVGVDATGVLVSWDGGDDRPSNFSPRELTHSAVGAKRLRYLTSSRII